MKYALIALGLMTTSAFAQQAFVPLTITEQDATNLRKYLDEQPLKFSLPVLQWIDQLEQRALAEKAKSEAK